MVLMGYSKSVVAGISWQTLLRIFTALLSLGKIAILARLLSPHDFGLFSLIAIALGLSEATTQTGINVTIIQSKQSIHYFLNTAWVIAIIRGLLIGCCMLVIGLGMSGYYEEPALQFLIAVAASVPVIKGFINPSIVLFQKNLDFFKDSAFRFAITLFEAVCAVIFGLWLQSVMALILALIGAAVFEVVLSFVVFRERPVFQYLPNRATTIFQNARGLTLSAFFNYISENIDDLLLGKVLGTELLGFYHNGYSLSHKPNGEIGRVIHHGTMPVFARITHDKTRLRRAFYRSITASILLTSTLSLPLFIAPKLLVRIVLGVEWLPVAEFLPWLGVAGLLQSVSLVTYGLFLAAGKYKALNYHLFANVLLMVPLVFVLATQFGLLGGVFGVLAARALSLPILIWGVRNVLRKTE
jgi:O-antigen/teichoic acid export membrane protein